MLKEERTKLQEYLKGIVNNLPDSPGCYQYLNDKGEVIYVGKAKKLKRRVSSYFIREQQNIKTRVLVSKIRDIKYIVVNTEEDALLLENNLIKRYKPHYNVLLKDDKTYPSICITNEDYPRVLKTRRRIRNGSEYFGPYSHVPTMYALLDVIKNICHPRPCHMAMKREGVESGKYKACLEYHIHNCAAPCIGKQSREDYLKQIEAAREILRGNTKELERKLRNDMQALAEQLRFEEAQVLKQKYILLENYCAKSEVVSNIVNNVDVFSIESDDNSAYINYMHVTKGMINQAFTFEYKKKLGESDEELLTLGITEMRNRYGSKAREIIVPFSLQIRPAQTGRKAQPRAKEHAADERDTKPAQTPQAPAPHRAFRQLQHQRQRRSGSVRSVRKAQTGQKGIQKIQHPHCCRPRRLRFDEGSGFPPLQPCH